MRGWILPVCERNKTRYFFRISSTFWLSGIYLIDRCFFIHQKTTQVAQARIIRPGIDIVYVNICLCHAIGAM